MNVISALMKEPRERPPHLFYHVSTQQENAIYEAESQPSPDTKSANVLSQTSQPPEG